MLPNPKTCPFKISNLLFMYRSLLLLFFFYPTSAQVTFILKLDPAAQTKEELFLAHNFNRWQAGDSNYQFKNGILSAELSRRNLLFKVCGKNWDQMEGNALGMAIPNRTGYFHNGDTVILEVKSWEYFKDHPPAGLQALHGPKELNYKGEKRKIWIYLPESYAQSDRNYPVLYMHDAQNLFQGLKGSASKWQIAQTLAASKTPLIVVAINHGEQKRIDELSPFPQEKYGGGEGDDYLHFIETQLKPYVNSHFRTRIDRSSTYIGGSSLGGLISLYALSKYPESYGGALIFSPAYWFNLEVLELARKFPPKKRTFVYQMVGDQEGTMPEEFQRDLQKCRQIFNEKPEIWTHHSEIVAGGKHNEDFWQKEFPKAIDWMFKHSPLKELEP